MSDELDAAIARLRAAAKEATRGPWQVQGDSVEACDTRDPVALRPGPSYSAQPDDDMAYIAACSPEVVVAILNDRERLAAERDALRSAGAWTRASLIAVPS